MHDQTPYGLAFPRIRSTKITLSDLSTSTVEMLTWYFQHHPDSTAHILGEICLQARVRLSLDLRFPRDARRADSRSGRSRERRSDDACPQKIPA
ncbi:hypothetical protein, partial [Streptomyces sp. NPDC058424]|uniref:hypothetical protein n=1 Tax=Streptomyces sp. NPDC058424 TaxID=3346491 RepID=UPI00365E445F